MCILETHYTNSPFQVHEDEGVEINFTLSPEFLVDTVPDI